MLRRTWISALGLMCAVAAVPMARAEAVGADVFVRTLSNEVIDAVKADKAIQAGDVGRIRALVDAKVMPHVNFQRMTAMSVGPQWRSATPEQQKRMLEEFKTLMVNTYSGALTQVKNQSVNVKPLRGTPAADGDLVVRTEVRGQGEPIQLDYRLEKAGEAWKIYDVNVGGFWVVEAYKGQFAKDLNAGGLDALITRLAEKNKATNGNTKN
ncbi:MlaC/ttg2D family ABC transporter substrate-binding protein [Aquabacterium sp.]|uniref:MlaC/ttg2D family ABC transporter substrate-binding protein n=1 Tax=Aquabacterium sp. TaxID=1872578 RepID=UPI002CFA5E8F|nr:ABC transporter substrate-binding protein [Aquabacterium sp.]HSW08570.1 ABC transporter substrate-binding protein [Aquabacterium sp.]